MEGNRSLSHSCYSWGTQSFPSRQLLVSVFPLEAGHRENALTLFIYVWPCRADTWDPSSLTQPAVETAPPALEARSLNHSIAREAQNVLLKLILHPSHAVSHSLAKV